MPKQFTFDANADINPSITVDNNDVLHVFWSSWRTGGWTFYKNSTDGGQSWSSPIELTGMVHYPSASYDKFNHGFLVTHQGGIPEDIWIKNISNNIISSTKTQITTDTSRDYDPFVVLDSANKTLVFWQSNREDGWQIWYKLSENLAKNWTTPLKITEIGAQAPCAAIDSDNNLYLTFSSDHSNNYIRFKGTASGTGNRYYYRDIAHPNYTVAPGDVLEYDIYFPVSSESFEGGIDLVYANGSSELWNLRGDPGALDQNSVPAHPSMSLELYAKGKWYHREIPIPLEIKVVSAVEMALEADSGTTEYYLRNIRIKNATSIKLSIYTNESSFIFPSESIAPGNQGYIDVVNEIASDLDIWYVFIPNATEDVDNDGLMGLEEYVYNTNAREADSDADGLNDSAEIQIYFTDPLNPDTDGDSMKDGWEIFYGLNPLNAIDGISNSDNDGLLNYEEYIYSTNPLTFDYFLETPLFSAQNAVQGENSSIQIDILNFLINPIEVNISIFNKFTIDLVHYWNFTLNPGNNLINTNLSIKEFASIGDHSITITISRLNHLILTNTTSVEIQAAYQFTNVQMPDSIIQDTHSTITLNLVNYRSIPVEYFVTLNGTGFIPFNRSFYLSPKEQKSIIIPLQFISSSIYERGMRSFTLMLTYKGQVVYRYEGEVEVKMSLTNIFLGYILPGVIGMAVVSGIVGYRKVKRARYKREIQQKKDRFHRLLPDLKTPIKLQDLPAYLNTKKLKFLRKELLTFLTEMVSSKEYSLETHGIWDEAEQVYIPPQYFRTVQMEIMQLIQEDLTSMRYYTEGKLVDTEDLRKIMIQRLAHSHHLSLDTIRQILHYLITNGKIPGYIEAKTLCLPLSYGVRVLIHNAWLNDLAPEGIARNFYELEKWSALIIRFIAEHQRPPEREEAWRLGIPFERIDAVLNYTNIQIRTNVLPNLLPIEKEYFDQLSIKVIKYLNQVKVKPTLTDLVVELGLGLKDAKLIIPFINEILEMRIQIEGMENKR